MCTDFKIITENISRYNSVVKELVYHSSLLLQTAYLKVLM